VPVLSLKVTGGSARPPEARHLGDGIFGIAEIAGAVTLALRIPFLALKKAMHPADLGGDTAGEDGTDARNGHQLRDSGIGCPFGGNPVVDLRELGFEEADVFEAQIKDALDR